jgi:hypothetical protein
MDLQNPPRSDVATTVSVSGKLSNPQTSTWDTIVGLIQNAFFKAISPASSSRRRAKIIRDTIGFIDDRLHIIDVLKFCVVKARPFVNLVIQKRKSVLAERMRTIMRKRIVGLTPETVSRSSENWLDLERLAQVEITSKAPNNRSSQRYGR